MRALTLRQPWAAAAVQFGMDVDNRKLGVDYRGLLAVHVASRRPGARDMAEIAELIAARAGVPAGRVLEAATVRGGLIAVVTLTGVCGPQSGRCGCGVWAQPGAFHLRLADVRPLAEPVPVTGAAGGQTLWALPYGVEKAVRAQLAAVPAPALPGGP